MILPWNGFKLLKQNHGAGASVNNARGFVQLSMNLSLWRTSWSPWMQSWDRTASGEEQMPNTARAKSWKLLLRAHGISFASCLCDIFCIVSSKAADHVNSSHIFSTVICISPALRNSSRPWSSWPWWNKRTWRSEMTDLPSFELYTAVAIALIPLASSQVDQEASAVGLFCNFFCKSLAKRTRLNTLIGTSAPFVSCTVLANIQAQALVGPFLPLLHFLTYMLSAATKPLRCLSAKGADVLITIHRLPERMLKAASFPMPMSFSISYSASRTAARSLSEKSAASASGIRKWVWWTSGSCEHPSTSDDCSLDSSTSPGNKTEMLDTKRPRNFLTHLTRAHIAGLWRSRSPPLETFLKAE